LVDSQDVEAMTHRGPLGGKCLAIVGEGDLAC
jgi:hypothetical protein